MSRGNVEAVKAAINIADVVRRYVDLKPVSGRWMGACPFHQETKPSMSVNDDEGFFYCFGCQASGDVIDFYMRINGLEFREALEQLAAEAGIELTDMRPDPQTDAKRQQKKLAMDLHAEAQQFFRRNLSHATGDEARRYLTNRGVSPEIIERFGLGYSPDDWHGLDKFLRSRGRKPEDSVMAGLLSKNDKGNIYDRFRGRLIFPIQNLSGKVIAFGGRIITDGEPKYLNSSDSPIYKKGDNLYGLNMARPAMNRTRRAILTEGYMDVLSLHQFGYEDSCGVLGTALTAQQVKRLAGFCSRVDLIFDGDNAGRKAALKSSRMILLQGLACRVVLMPEGEDVDSLLQAQGRDGLDSCMDQAPDGLQFCMDTLRRDFSPREIMDWARGFLGELADNALRAYYVPRLAEGLMLGEVELRQQANMAGGRTGGQAEQPRQEQQAAPVMTNSKEDKDDRYFLSFPIQHPEYVTQLVALQFGNILSTDWGRALWMKLGQQQHADILSRLNEQEKRFFIQCRQSGLENPLNEQALLDEWEHICNKIRLGQEKYARNYLKEELHKATLAGDMQRVGECLRALQESVGSKNEQH